MYFNFVFVESDRERFESRVPTSPTRSQVQLPKGMENTFTRGRYAPSGNVCEGPRSNFTLIYPQNYQTSLFHALNLITDYFTLNN